MFVGYGSEPNFSGFTKNGKLLYGARQSEGNGSGGFALAGSATKRSFETRIDIGGPVDQVSVRAIGNKGRVLSTTDAIDVVQ